MDKFLAILCLVVVVAIIIAGELYLKMDKNRTFALVFLKKMNDGIENWVSIADKLFQTGNVSSSAAEEYSALEANLHSIKKKHAYKKVPLINQIHALAVKSVSENINNPQVSSLGNELTYAFLEFSNMQSEYNLSASAVNAALEKTVSGRIGKIMHIHPMDKMDDLTVL